MQNYFQLLNSLNSVVSVTKSDITCIVQKLLIINSIVKHTWKQIKLSYSFGKNNVNLNITKLIYSAYLHTLLSYEITENTKFLLTQKILCKFLEEYHA